MAKFKCPHCGKPINPAALMGQVTSEAKTKTAVENGKKGGRPRKKDTGGNESDNKAKPSSTTPPLPAKSPKRGKKF